MASCQFSTERSKPKSLTARSRLDASVSAQTTSFGSKERFGKREGMRSMDLECASPIQPRPRTAIPIRWFMIYLFLGVAEVQGSLGSWVWVFQFSRIQCLSGSSQKAIVLSGAGPASTFKKYIGYSGVALVGPW